MKFLYRIENPKLINSVAPLPYIRSNDSIIDRKRMAEFFFESKHQNDVLGIAEVEKDSVVDQTNNQVNLNNNDNFEFNRIEHWEENFARAYDSTSWNKLLEKNPFADSVAKVFWLSDHLRKNGKIDFPISQAWNRYYDTWETVVGNGRIAPLRLFYHKRTLKVIRFKTRYCERKIDFETTFDSLESIEKYFNYSASINYRAWGGSLIPGVHFYNKDGYYLNKLEYQNKLAGYFFKNKKSLGINKEKNLHWNINNILDGLNALG